MGERHDYAFEGSVLDVHVEARASKESTLVGNVTVEANASVWPGVVLRGDVGPVVVGYSSELASKCVPALRFGTLAAAGGSKIGLVFAVLC